MFSCVRSRNPVPTPLELKNNLRILTVSQYLKAAETGNCDVDEGTVAADFFSWPTHIVCDDTCDEIYADCIPLIKCNDVRAEMDTVELSCLYYLGGYVLSRVKKNEAVCASCINAVCTQNVAEEFDLEITALLRHKSYRDNCLLACSALVFDLFVVCETIFRQCEESFMSSTSSIKHQLVHELETKCSDMALTECHSIKSKIISRFTSVRLQFFC